MKHTLRRFGIVTLLAGYMAASGCSLLQSGGKPSGASHSAAKKTAASPVSHKAPADSIPNASEVGL